MKKFYIILTSLICLFSGILFCGCNKKKDDLETLSKNLTTYNISLELNEENKTVKAKQTVIYANNTDSILKHIKFHLYPQYFEQGATDTVISATQLNNAYPNGMSYAEFNIERVQVEKSDSPIEYEGEHNGILCVTLNNSLTPDSVCEIQIDFSFTIPNCNHRFGYGENTINLANFYPIACVFENGEFSTKPYHANGDPFYSDMSNYCVEVLHSNQYIVASSGTKTSEKQGEKTTKSTFKANMIRDFALVLSSKFETLSTKVGNTEISYYYFSDSTPEQSLKASADSIETFSKLFGDYPYPSYSVVETDFVHGGMEYPNLVMIATDIEDKNDYLNVIIHETAHQWWYGIVGNDEYTHPWIDEALTEFSTLIFYDNNDGYEYSHKQIIDSATDNYTLFVSVYEDVLGSLDTSMRAVDQYSTEPEYTYCIYVKGVLMFDSLYQLIGEKDFYNALRIYYNVNKYKNATPNDLISAFEQGSGTELDNFFSAWLNGKVQIK